MQDQDQKLSELETENRKMKLELEEYRAEATHLKNQQATIRRLEERNRQLEQQVCSVLVSPFSYMLYYQFIIHVFVFLLLCDIGVINMGSSCPVSLPIIRIYFIHRIILIKILDFSPS